MIYIISSKYIAGTGRISWRYMFDIDENIFNVDKIISLPYGYFWNTDNRYVLNLFEAGKNMIFGIGGTINELSGLLKQEEIPDCSILMTNNNARVFIKILEENNIKYEWYKHNEDYLRTSDQHRVPIEMIYMDTAEMKDKVEQHIKDDVIQLHMKYFYIPFNDIMEIYCAGMNRALDETSGE